MAQLNFDSSQVAPDTSAKPVPAGDYLANITESDVVSLKSGNGQALKLTFVILDGPSKGRKIWEALNIAHSNATAQQIAQSQLSAICHAIGVIKVTDTSMLHFKPLVITVAVRPAEGDYAAKNTIKGYSAAGGGAPVQMPAGSAPAAPAANAAAPAWARKA